MARLLARYADASFWMARYMERAENLARVIDVNATFARYDTGASTWTPIIELYANQEAFAAKYAEADQASVVRFSLLDLDSLQSIRAMVRAARENARTLRPLISTEMWMHLNTFHDWMGNLRPNRIAEPHLPRLCAAIKERCQAHAGIVEGTFFRDEGWSFYQLGMMIERADQTTRLVDIKYHTLLPNPEDVGSAHDVSQWNSLLRSAAGYHAFRRIHPRGLQPADVAGFLLLNPSFPRSLSRCVDDVNELLTSLKSKYGLTGGNSALERLDELQAVLLEANIKEVIGHGLHEFIDWVQRQLNTVTDQIVADFFGL